MKQLRTMCRNPRCRLKLPEPVENPHAAFCTPGCWRQYHRSRCAVCEREYERKAENQFLCGRRNCRNEYAQWPHVYLPFGPAGGSRAQKPKADAKSARKTAFEMPLSLRRWSWQRLADEDEDYELLNAEGKMVARIRQEGALWWVARPRCIPEPPLETLDEARSRAVNMALMTLPSPAANQNKRIIKEVLQERELFPWRFSDAGKRYARGGEINVRQWEPAACNEAPDIPDFLLRKREAAYENV